MIFARKFDRFEFQLKLIQFQHIWFKNVQNCLISTIWTEFIKWKLLAQSKNGSTNILWLFSPLFDDTIFSLSHAWNSNLIPMTPQIRKSVGLFMLGIEFEFEFVFVTLAVITLFDDPQLCDFNEICIHTVPIQTILRFYFFFSFFRL